MSDISCLRPANESCFELKAKVKGIHTSHANIFGRSKYRWSHNVVNVKDWKACGRHSSVLFYTRNYMKNKKNVTAKNTERSLSVLNFVAKSPDGCNLRDTSASLCWWLTTNSTRYWLSTAWNQRQERYFFKNVGNGYLLNFLLYKIWCYCCVRIEMFSLWTSLRCSRPTYRI